MEVATIILIILIVLLIIVLSGHVIVVSKQSSYPVPVPVPVPVYKPMVGGCAGTRYGCCPNSTVPKLNPMGTNC